MFCYFHSRDTNVFEEIGWFIVCNASFNNISVISWQSVLMGVLSGEAKNTNFIVVCLYEENDSLIVLLVDNQYQFRRGRDNGFVCDK
jgi:hypothetical protein